MRQGEHNHQPVPIGQKELLTAAAPALITDVLTRYGRLRLRAFGSSMTPAIRPGDVLCVEGCTADEARPGDVLLMRQGERVLAHRLIRKQRHGVEVLLVTRGDSLWHTDSDHPVPIVLGRVTGIGSITWLGRLYGVTLTEATRLSSSVRSWMASLAAAALRTTIGSANNSA